MTRILITGSRDWEDHATIANAILAAVEAGRPNVIVHGGCPTGADRLASEIAEACNLPVETHVADWRKYGRSAGPIRNRHMVSLGADVCLAFIGPCTAVRCKTTLPHPSHGASSTAKMAEAAGIPTRRYYA